MLKHKDHFHGSDLNEIEKVYGIKKENIVSFSANVNPLGISTHLKDTLISHLDAIASYPDRDYTSLRSCIGAYCGCEPDNIIVGNGSTELISLFIQTEQIKKAMIIGPTYSEYEREIFLGGGKSHYYPLKEECKFQLDVNDLISTLDESIDLLVICNPNNPTSSAIECEQMRLILDACKQLDIFVMIDETYVEFAPSPETITSISLTNFYNNIIILRGTSKFFAAPGLRLGYAITGNRDLIKTINTRKNPWTINSLAAIAGELMFTDTAYISETRALICKERERIFQYFKQHDDFEPFYPYANFMLLKILREDINSFTLFERAIKDGLMIRDCSTFPFLNQKFIRFCVMMPADNDRLMACLSQSE